MYDFREINSEYILTTTIGNSLGLESSLEVIYSIKAGYRSFDEDFMFSIDRKRIKLNAKKQDSYALVDQMMQRIGDALYPVDLIVSSDAKILNVKNFEEVLNRWNSEVDNILTDSYSLPVKRYIDMAKPNMTDKKNFLKAFSRQTFIQIFFRDTNDEFFWFTTKGLTDVFSHDTVRVEKTGSNKQTVYFETVEEWGNECSFEYVFSEFGDIISVNGAIKSIDENSDSVIKNVSLCINNDKREVKKTNKIVSFFLD